MIILNRDLVEPPIIDTQTKPAYFFLHKEYGVTCSRSGGSDKTGGQIFLDIGPQNL